MIGKSKEFKSMQHFKNLFKTIQQYYDNLDSYKVRSVPEYGFLKKEMPEMFSETPRDSKDLLSEYMEKCVPYTTHWQSPHYYSFFPSNSLPSTSLGEMIMSGVNEGNNTLSDKWEKRNAELEEKVLDWITNILKIPECFHRKNGGRTVLYPTAGAAFLNVGHAAKNKKQMELSPKNIIDKQVGYMTNIGNTAVERSITFTNLILKKISPIEESKYVDEFPITSEYLEEIFQKDVDNGLVPTFFITTLGSTASLSIEDIKGISTACSKFGVWLHIDSAQLGIYGVIPEYRYILDNIEYGDSFSTNGHKSLGCGMGTSFFWTKHTDYNKYMTYKSDPTEDKKEFSLEDRSCFNLTPNNNNRSLRVMTVLLSLGKKGIIENFRKHFELADYFRELILSDDRFELLEVKNKFPWVLFRLKGLTNEQNDNYYDEVMKSNKIYLVMSIVHNIAFLRLSVGTYTQEEYHIKEAFEHLQSCAEDYLKSLSNAKSIN